MHALEGNDAMPFGKHKGVTMDDVPVSVDAEAVRDYISRNRIAIDKDLDDAGLIPRRFVGKK